MWQIVSYTQGLKMINWNILKGKYSIISKWTGDRDEEGMFKHLESNLEVLSCVCGYGIRI